MSKAEQEPGGERLTELRQAIADVDRSLLELIHRRMDLTAEVGRVKAAAGQPIVVPEVHSRVLTRARLHAEACGVSEEVMESIFQAVTRGSIERQHRVGLALRGEAGNRLLILGGLGSMGSWFHRFAQLLGHPVDLIDPAMASLPSAPGRFASLDDIADLDAYEAILVSVPLSGTVEVLEALIERRPKALIIEIASIKSHLETVLERGTEAGLRLLSLHPMFGPSKSPYEPLTFVLACREDPQEEKKRIEKWLRHPYTDLVPVPFAHHDRLMGWLLGLAHLSSMLFGCALTRSGLGISELKTCASTTFNREAAGALLVLSEDPDLYFEIQRLNPHRNEVYQSIQEALKELIDAVQSDDHDSFSETVNAARQFLRA